MHVFGELAYKDEEFLDSEEARPLRILAEYMQPMRALANEGVVGTIVFFGSARIRPGGPMHRFYDDAVELASLVTNARTSPQATFAFSRRSWATSRTCAISFRTGAICEIAN